MHFRCLRLARGLGFALVGFGAAAVGWAQPAQNPPGFNAPDGHGPEKSQSQAFARYQDGDTYVCMPQKKRCTGKDVGFDDAGKAVAEGPMVVTDYKRNDGSRLEGLLLQRNYERVIREMGGHLHAVMFGQDEGRGFMKQVHLLDRNGQRQWIMVNTFADSTRLKLTIVTLGEAPNILAAADLQKQIDSQGFATLHLNFDTNKSDIRDGDRPALDQVTLLLKNAPGLRLSVNGHTDNVGGASPNKLLSEQRAQAIVNYLAGAGVVRDRMVAKGLGLEQPVADNRTDEGRAKNRRVELVKVGGSDPTPVAKSTAVLDVAPDDLAVFLAKNERVVVQFTSPAKSCTYCIGADVLFTNAVSQMGTSGWMYVRTQWPVWNQFPPIAQASGVLGVPDQVVFSRGEVIGRVVGRQADAAALAEKLRDAQKKAP